MSSLGAAARDIQQGLGEAVWGSNSGIGLEDSPWCALPCTSVPMLCLSSILRRWRGEIYQQIQLHAENSEVPAEKGLEWASPSPRPPPILPTFLLHYFSPQESILHHVNVM